MLEGNPVEVKWQENLTREDYRNVKYFCLRVQTLVFVPRITCQHDTIVEGDIPGETLELNLRLNES